MLFVSSDLYEETYSQVAYLNSVRAMLAKCGAGGMEFEQCDVDTAFLYGKLEEEIYIELPEGLRGLLELAEAEGEDDVVCMLLQSFRQAQPFLENSGEKHWDAGIKVVRYLLKTKDVGIVYDGLLGTQLEAYSDEYWAGHRDDQRPVSGMLLKLCGAPVVWRSTFQKTVARSSTEAEYMVLSDCVKECVWMRRLLKGIGAEQVGATVIYDDNQGAMTLAKNVGYQARTKHIDIRYHFIREKVVSNEVELEYVDTKNQHADFMTKGLLSKTLCYFIMRSNVGPKLETSN
ncbi:hypothetical protein PR003_g16040 [Phytophthora rubi]|uniref:Reverse transcriptase Ty1/copia-type domain-containing protein n=1 Tax=Phytophthora rubi TaxID=129364 RepID=A0A6A4F106_9STRA|nr:hypothetical protein PR003_g16040 [Phytophthora rubi]